jgi:hypothetical protein
MEYKAESAKHWHTFAEVNFQPLNSAAVGYNFVVLARISDDGSTKKFYEVKTVKEYLHACRPTMFLVNAIEASDLGVYEASLIQSPPADCLTCSDYPVPAEACLQMSENDPEPDFNSDDVWLRIEVMDDGDPPHPIIIGTLAWDCTDGSSIDSCTGKFQFDREDHADDGGMFGISGSWALEAHDEQYLIKLFRAGSEPE